MSLEKLQRGEGLWGGKTKFPSPVSHALSRAQIGPKTREKEDEERVRKAEYPMRHPDECHQLLVRNKGADIGVF